MGWVYPSAEVDNPGYSCEIWIAVTKGISRKRLTIACARGMQAGCFIPLSGDKA
ncbi:MAG: hypothetical protein ACLS4Z_06445 [Christensenellaceae bacterium]